MSRSPLAVALLSVASVGRYGFPSGNAPAPLGDSASTALDTTPDNFTFGACQAHGDDFFASGTRRVPLLAPDAAPGAHTAAATMLHLRQGALFELALPPAPSPAPVGHATVEASRPHPPPWPDGITLHPRATSSTWGLTCESY